LDADDSDDDDSEEESADDKEDDEADDDDDDDDEAELLRELEKIKRERAIEQEKKVCSLFFAFPLSSNHTDIFFLFFFDF
jgi:hypothetical protein